jgi:phage shock protein PspC (stress-responsive transcriptional regulator)
MTTSPSPTSDAPGTPAPEYGTPDPGGAGPAGSASEPVSEPVSEPASHPGPGGLRRSDRRLVAGVCGGIAEYLRVDPTLVRLAIVLLTLFGGSGVVIYAAGWLVMPDARGDVVAQRLVERLRR